MTKVQDPCGAYAAQVPRWAMLRALLGGTETMRQAGKTLLKPWPKESEEKYKRRLDYSTLFPAFARTVSVMSGKPFSKPITLGEDVPPRVVELLDNVDDQGRSLHRFCAETFPLALAFGMFGVLVDFPSIPEAQTQADVQRAGARPYFVVYRHDQIIGWRSKLVGGRHILTQLRLRELATVPDGDYGEAVVERVRVFAPGAFEVWERRDSGAEFSLVRSGATPSMPSIPFVAFYGEFVEFMVGKSPLLELAHLNVKHWNSQSDQDNLLHVARVPILTLSGAEDDESSIVVGASGILPLPSGAELKYVEHTGKAIDAGQASLDALERQMLHVGAELLLARPGAERTATEFAGEAEANKCDLQRLAERFEDGIDECLQLMAMWIGEAEGGSATVYKDFGAATLSDASAKLLLEMKSAGVISTATLIKEQQRRGVLSADIDPEAEASAVASEGPALGEMGLDGLPPIDGAPAPEGDPLARPGSGSPSGAPAPAPAPAVPDFAPLVAAIEALVAKEVPAPTITLPAPAEPPPAPDFAGLIDAVRALAEREMPAPSVTIEGATINVAPPEVNIAPTQVNVRVDKQGAIRFTEDDDGNLTGAEPVEPSAP